MKRKTLAGNSWDPGGAILNIRTSSTALRKPVGAVRSSGVARTTAAVAVLAAVWTLAATGAANQSDVARADLLQALPRASELPPAFRAAGELAGHGVFHSAAGEFAYRRDDGGATHGSNSLPIWEKSEKDNPTQGVLYGVQDGAVVSAGYLIRHADIAAHKSFRHLSLRGLDFPAPQHLTIDFIAGDTTGDDRHLLLWHFVPLEGPVMPTLSAGSLPPVASLPARFGLYACEQFPNDFCPRMGRHHRDLSGGANRPPDATGDHGVTYGEAAGRLIFIEHVLSQPDLLAGATWNPIPLNGLPIPPIDNLHLLHYNGNDGPVGRYTAHMYFVPERTYLGWDESPDKL